MKTTIAIVAACLAVTFAVDARGATTEPLEPGAPLRRLRHRDRLRRVRDDAARRQPDGTPLRTWSIGTTPSRVAFVAEADGVHRLEFVRAGTAGPGATGTDAAGQVTIDSVSVTSLDARLQPRVRGRSPMMRELRQRVAGGEWNPEIFWRDVAHKGTPIVEEGDDRRYQIVTFLWRARRERRNVSVIGTFMKAPLAEPLHHIAGTDVWYRTFHIPAGARFSHFLSPNPLDLRWAGRRPAVCHPPGRPAQPGSVNVRPRRGHLSLPVSRRASKCRAAAVDRRARDRRERRPDAAPDLEPGSP